MKIKLNNNLLRNIDTIARELHSIYESKFKKYNLTKGQFLFLTRVCENQGISLVELSRQLKVDKTTATKAIQKLITAGYIYKSNDEVDKRFYHLNSTQQANEIYSMIITEKNKVIDICLNGFNQKDIKTFDTLLTKMLENLTKEWQTIKGKTVKNED